MQRPHRTEGNRSFPIDTFVPVDFAPKQRNHFSFHSTAASELEYMHYPAGLSVLCLVRAHERAG